MMDDFVVEYISTDYFLSLAFRRDFSCPSLYVFETFQQRIHHPAKKHLVPCHSRGTLRVSRGVTKFSLFFFSFFFKLKKNSFSNIFLVLNELLFLSSSVLLHSLSRLFFISNFHLIDDVWKRRRDRATRWWWRPYIPKGNFFRFDG